MPPIYIEEPAISYEEVIPGYEDVILEFEEEFPDYEILVGTEQMARGMVDSVLKCKIQTESGFVVTFVKHILFYSTLYSTIQTFDKLKQDIFL